MLRYEVMENIMWNCIELAKDNLDGDQYPIGAIITDYEGNVIEKSSSSLRQQVDPTNHPEIDVIRKASILMQSRFLKGCYLFTTLEPCPMCTSATIWAKMQGIVYGAYQEDALDFIKDHVDHKLSWRQINVKAKDIIKYGNPTLELYEGLLRDECRKLFI